MIRYTLLGLNFLFLVSCQQYHNTNPLVQIDSLNYQSLIDHNDLLMKTNDSLFAELLAKDQKLDSLIEILPALKTINEFKQPYAVFYLYPEKQNEITIAIKGKLSESTDSVGDFKFMRLFNTLEIDLYSDSHYNTSYQQTEGEILFKNAGYNVFYGRISEAYSFTNKSERLKFIMFTNHFSCGQVITVWEDSDDAIRFQGIVDVGFCGGETDGYNRISKISNFRNKGVTGFFADALIIEISKTSGDEGYTWGSKRIGILYKDWHLEMIYENNFNGSYEESEEGYLNEFIRTDMNHMNDLLTIQKIDKSLDGKETILESDTFNIKEIIDRHLERQ